jgi:hypothetical protein
MDRRGCDKDLAILCAASKTGTVPLLGSEDDIDESIEFLR